MNNKISVNQILAFETGFQVQLRNLSDFISVPSDDPGLIDVINVDLNIPKNTEEHHTDQFEITDKLDGDNRENLVIRRGQKFTIKIEFNREYYKDKDDLRLVFQFGKCLNQMK